MAAKKTILLNGVEVKTQTTDFGEYLCITDLAKVVGDKTGGILGNWLRLIGTIEFLKEWELKYNPENFNVLGYEDIRMKAGTISFAMSAKKWIESTNAKGIFSNSGKYGGTYAHNAIALEFCSTVSPAFKLGVYVDYIQLKEDSAQRLLNTYELFLKKIEDNSLESNRFAREMQEEMKKLK